MKSRANNEHPKSFIAHNHNKVLWIIAILVLIYLIIFSYKRHYSTRISANVYSTPKKSFSSNSVEDIKDTDKTKTFIQMGPPLAETTSKIANSAFILSVISADSEETAAENGSASNAVDGNPLTIWHTQWTDKGKYLRGDSPRCPHEIIIKLTPPSKICGITYLPRRGDIPHGDIRKYEVFLSTDGVEFGAPIKSGEFTDGKDLKIVSFQPTICAFFKLKALSEINGNPYTSAAEIDVVREGEIPDISGRKEFVPDF